VVTSSPLDTPSVSQDDSGRSLTRLIVVLLALFFVAEAAFAPKPLLDMGDGLNAILPLQVIGVRETLRGNFCWTDELGLGYPLMNELNFQQANPFNLLYLALDPIRAFHVQVVAWIVLLALSAWLCLRRLFPRFGALEWAIYLALVMNSPAFQDALCYQVIFLSSFAILPFAWLQVRKVYARCRPLDVIFLALAIVLLVHSQYNFTFVPNLFVLGLIVAIELWEAGARQRRNQAIFAILTALIAGFAFFHLFDILEILRLSNRKDLSHLKLGSTGSFGMLLAKIFPSTLKANVYRLFRSGEWQVIGSSLGLIIFLHLRSRSRALFPTRFHVTFFFLLSGLTSLALVFFDAARHLERIAVLALFFGATWFSLIAGGLVRKIAVLVGEERRQRTFLAIFAVAGVLRALYCLEADPRVFGLSTFERHHEIASALDGLFGGKLPDDLDRYRVGSVVEDEFQYTLPNLTRSLYQPSQAVLYGFRETGYYGSYLINGAHRPQTYEQIVTIQRFGIYGNLTALARSGISEPVLRLLNVKYLVAHEDLDSTEVVQRGTIPAQDPPGFERQRLYELRHPLPRAWSIHLPGDVLQDLERLTFDEATDRLEGFLRDGLARGSIDAGASELRVRRSFRTLGIDGLASPPRLVFVSMPFWPAWTPNTKAARLLAPFGLTALVVDRDAGDSLELRFWPSTAGPKIAGAFLIFGAIVASAWARR